MPSVGSFSLDRTRMPLEISIAEWGRSNVVVSVWYRNNGDMESLAPSSLLTTAL